MFSTVIKETYTMLRSQKISHWVPILPVVILQSTLDFLHAYSYIASKAFAVLLGIALSVVLATTTHRLVLLGKDSVPQYGFGVWTRREVLFACYMIGLNLLFVVPFTMIAILVIALIGVSIELPILGSFGLFALAVGLPILVLISRFCLVLPATAVDDPIRLSGSWRLTAGNGMTVFFLYCILPIGLVLPSFVLLYYQHEAAYLLASLLGSAGLVVGIMVLSETYQVLRHAETIV